MYELYALMAAILVVIMYCILEYWVFNPEGQSTVKLVSIDCLVVLILPVTGDDIDTKNVFFFMDIVNV